MRWCVTDWSSSGATVRVCSSIASSGAAAGSSNVSEDRFLRIRRPPC